MVKINEGRGPQWCPQGWYPACPLFLISTPIATGCNAELMLDLRPGLGTPAMAASSCKTMPRHTVHLSKTPVRTTIKQVLNPCSELFQSIAYYTVRNCFSEVHCSLILKGCLDMLDNVATQDPVLLHRFTQQAGTFAVW